MKKLKLLTPNMEYEIQNKFKFMRSSKHSLLSKIFPNQLVEKETRVKRRIKLSNFRIRKD